MTDVSTTTQEARQSAEGLIKIHEALRLFPYLDTKGNLTIGYGRNLKVDGISTLEALNMLNNDLDYIVPNLFGKLPWLISLGASRLAAIIDMTFNLGIKGILEFSTFLEYLEKKDFENAAKDLLTCKVASECKKRYMDLAEIIRTGNIIWTSL